MCRNADKRGNVRAGFTLVEFSVAITIVVVLSAIALVNYRGASQGEVLGRGAHTVAVDLRRIQNMALSAALITSPTGPTVPLGGYGVFFPSPLGRNYVLFADRNGNQIYDAGAVPSELLEDKTLEAGVHFSAFLTGTTPVGSSLTVLFCPPYAHTLLYMGADARGSFCNGNQATLQQSFVVKLAGSSGTPATNTIRDVRINATGALDIVSDSELP